MTVEPLLPRVSLCGPFVCTGDTSQTGDNDRLQCALLSALGKPRVELIQVDVGASLAKLGLASFLPVDVWPPTNAVRELATKIKTRKKLGEEHVFVFAELKKFVVPEHWPAMCILLHLLVKVSAGIVPGFHASRFGEPRAMERAERI